MEKNCWKTFKTNIFLWWWLKFVEAFGRCAPQLIILASHRKKHKSNSFVFLYTFVLCLVYNAIYDRNTTNMVTNYLSAYEKCHCAANNRLISKLISPLTQIIEQESRFQINFLWSVNEKQYWISSNWNWNWSCEKNDFWIACICGDDNIWLFAKLQIYLT